jgi:D-glycero-D-manno-heptose 1,7-bisphosphate phosphatase
MEGVSTVFLDRDGVINRLRSDYVTSWETFELLPRAKEALRLLRAAGLRVVVVTNQRAVARGLLSIADLEMMHARMRTEVAAAGGDIEAIYYCPHDVGQCACRKPQVGMFLQAQRDIPTIDFSQSVVVGDSMSDLEAGRRLGCRLILVTDTGCTDCTDDVASKAQAASLQLAGIAPTLYEAVAQYLLAAGPESTESTGGQSRK